MDIRELLDKAGRKLFKARSADRNGPLVNIILKKKDTKYHPRNRTFQRPVINYFG